MKTRYPGTVPFTSADEEIFFGRDTEISDLTRLVKLRRLSVLYGRSGLGKSSLLGAGLIPRLQKQGVDCIRVRFGSYQNRSSILPLLTFSQAISEQALGKEVSVPLDTDVPSLWQLCKYIQHDLIANGVQEPSILFVFDQFEELFTYPDRGEKFALALGELLHDQMPRSFQLGLDQALDEGGDWPSDEELAFWQRPLQVKALLAIRSDKLSQLDHISDYLPYVLNHRYELQPLQEEGAKLAIASPALLEGDFPTPAFSYQEKTLAAMLEALKDANGSVEPFQLQILCQHLEQTIQKHPMFLAPAASQERLPQLPPTVLPDTDRLFRDYYENALAQLDTDESRLQAQKLIEEGLVQAEEERRLTLDQAQIQSTYQVSPTLLQQLVDIRLLRVEPNRLGGVSYELSHDTLIPSILQARAEREQAEKVEREKEAAQAQFQQGLRRVGLAVLLLFLVTIGGLVFALYQQNQDLQEASNQILRAYRELSSFIKLDEAEPDAEADVADQMRDLTNELDRAKRAMRERVITFDRISREFDEELNSDNLNPAELKSLVEAYQTSVDSIIEKSIIIEVKSIEEELTRFNLLSPIQREEEINAKIREANRLEDLGKIEAAYQKWQNILFLSPDHPSGKATLLRLQKLLGQMDPLHSDSVKGPTSGVADHPPSQDSTTLLALVKKKPDTSTVTPPTSETISFNLDSALNVILQYTDLHVRLEALTNLRPLVQRDPQNSEKLETLIEYLHKQIEENQLASNKRVREDQEDTEFQTSLRNVLLLRDESEKEAALTFLMRKYPEKEDQINAELEKIKKSDMSTTSPILPKMIRLEGGVFQMGSNRYEIHERPEHKVTLSYFSLSQTEITHEQFAVFLNSKGNQIEGGRTWYNPSHPSSYLHKNSEGQWIVESGYENHPIVWVTWYGANAFCQWLSEETGQNYRLPTEAEWEYAAGGGSVTRTIYSGTNDHADLYYYAWHDGVSGNRLNKVMRKRPNRLGFYDMSGNVLEWCNDFFGDYSSSAQTNPKGPRRTAFKVQRGGSYYSVPLECGVAKRLYGNPKKSYNHVGFRIALSQ